MTNCPPSAYDITAGLKTDCLADLTPKQVDIIVALLARASERSYRRGFQQAAVISRKRPGDLPTDLHAWRYGTTTDVSTWGDCARREPSLDRLHIENPALAQLGFPRRRDAFAAIRKAG